MPKFITDWKKIGQSGPTIDGRTINPEWLTQAAENYGPDTYTAMIWPDHSRWYGNYGQVRELKTEQEGNIVSLYARLQPNTWLLDLNRQDQNLFTSMELDPDFADTGKCYLVGLGVTDEPASLGTHELMFKSRKQHERNRIVCGVELDRLQPAESESSALSRLIGEFSRLFQHQPPSTNEEAMDEKQFKELTDAIGAQTTAISDLAEKFTAQAAGGQAPETPATPPETPAAGDGDDTAKQFETVTQTLSTVVEKLTALETRMEGQKPGTQTPETPQPADGGDDIL